MGTLVYSGHPSEGAASTCLAIIFEQIASGYPGSSDQQQSYKCTSGIGPQENPLDMPRTLIGRVKKITYHKPETFENSIQTISLIRHYNRPN